MAKAKTVKGDEGLRVVGTVSTSPSKFRLVPAFMGRIELVGDSEVIALAESITRDGQQQPIQVRAVAGTDEYEVIFGNTRKRAADLIVAGFKDSKDKDVKPNPDFKLRAEVVEVEDSEAFRRNVVEQAFRNDCTAIDNARNQAKLRDEYEMTDAAIARIYGYDQANVTRLKKLLTLPEDIQQQIHKGNCSARAGVLLADAKDVTDAGAIEAVWKLCKGDELDGDGKGNIGESQMANAIKAWRVAEKEKAATATATPTVNPDGTPVVPPTNPDGSPVVAPATNPDGSPVVATEPTIGLSYKQFKDIFRATIADARCPDGLKGVFQMTLDLAEGKVTPKDYSVFMLATTGEELLPAPVEVAVDPAVAPMPSPVPQQPVTPVAPVAATPVAPAASNNRKAKRK